MTQVTQTDAKTSELVTYVENRSSGFFLHVVSLFSQFPKPPWESEVNCMLVLVKAIWYCTSHTYYILVLRTHS